MKLLVKPSTIRRLIYKIFANIDALAGFENKQIVFSLHGVSKDKWYYNNTKGFIKKLVATMISKGWQPGKISQLKENTRWGKRNFYLTFDDGYKNIMSLTEFFKINNVTPAVFLISDPNKRSIEELTTSAPVLDRHDISVLKKLGWEFGSHSRTHADFYKLKTASKIADEVVESKKELEKKYNIDVKYFAYPKGRYDKRILSYVKSAGYKYGLSMDDSIIGTTTKNYKIPRVGLNASHTVEEAINSSSPSVVYFRSALKEILKKAKYL